jgi:hypothetical protein
VAVTYSSIPDLVAVLRGAETADGRHEQQIGHTDADWPDWYAQYLAPAQAGAASPIAGEAR